MITAFVNKGSDADLVKSMMDNGKIDEELAKSMGISDASRDNCAEGDNNDGDEEKLSKGGGVCPECGQNPCVCKEDITKSEADGDNTEGSKEKLQKSDAEGDQNTPPE